MDEDYIKGIAEGNKDILKQIYTQFLPRITNFIKSNGGNSDDAKDIFQDAIIIIYEKVNTTNFILSSKFYTLLYGVCRNLWGNRLQKKSSKEVTIPENIKYKSDQDIESAILREEEAMIFRSGFEKLGEDCQKLLQLFFDKIKMEEIAQFMGFSSVNYAKKRKFQCKEKLIELIKGDRRYKEIQDDI